MKILILILGIIFWVEGASAKAPRTYSKEEVAAIRMRSALSSRVNLAKALKIGVVSKREAERLDAERKAREAQRKASTSSNDESDNGLVRPPAEKKYESESLPMKKYIK